MTRPHATPAPTGGLPTDRFLFAGFLPAARAARQKALKELRSLIKDYPGFLSARVRLGKILYDGGDVEGAIEQWEAATHRDPSHGEAQRLLRQAQALTQKSLEL